MSFYKAINYWVLGGFDDSKGPYKAIEDAATMGMDGLEITVGDCIPADISESECKQIAAAAANAGIKLRTLATGFYWGCSLASPDMTERNKAIDFTRKYIRIAAALGSETILVVPGAVDVAWDPSRPVVPYQQVWDNSIESLRQVLPEAEKLGINIALENVWNKFLLSPIEMNRRLFRYRQRHHHRLSATLDRNPRQSDYGCTYQELYPLRLRWRNSRLRR